MAAITHIFRWCRNTRAGAAHADDPSRVRSPAPPHTSSAKVGERRSESREGTHGEAAQDGGTGPVNRRIPRRQRRRWRRRERGGRREVVNTVSGWEEGR